MDLQDNETFYGACAEALGIPHDYRRPVRRRTRWSNRRLGNGRFPGFGLVRLHGETVIVMSHQGTKPFNTRGEALAWLRNLPKQPAQEL